MLSPSSEMKLCQLREWMKEVCTSTSAQLSENNERLLQRAVCLVRPIRGDIERMLRGGQRKEGVDGGMGAGGGDNLQRRDKETESEEERGLGVEELVRFVQMDPSRKEMLLYLREMKVV